LKSIWYEILKSIWYEILKSIWYQFLQTNAYQKKNDREFFWSDFKMSSENVDFF
jgi:hypothetical protein